MQKNDFMTEGVYGVTYYKDGEKCESIMQEEYITEPGGSGLVIRNGILATDRYSGYVLDHVTPDVKDGDSIPIGTMVKAYYIKVPVEDGIYMYSSCDASDFVIEGNCVVDYKGNATCIDIPEGIEVIGEEAFRGCDTVERVNFPKSLKVIADEAFEECSALKGILSFPENLITIGYAAFLGCGELESVDFPEGLAEIGDAAFFECTSLQGDIRIPKTVVEVGNNAFWGCDQAEILLPLGVEERIPTPEENSESEESLSTWEKENLTWNNHDELEERIWQESDEDKFTEIDGNDFKVQGSLLVKYEGEESNIIIPEGIEIIGEGAFKECDTLESLYFPESLRVIKDEAFEECTELKGILRFPSNLVEIGYAAFLGCTGLEGVEFPGSLEIIGDAAFFECSSLKGMVRIPKSVSHVGKNAFWGCDSAELITAADQRESSFGFWKAFKKVVSETEEKLSDDFIIQSGTLVKYQGAGGHVVIPEGVEVIGVGAFKGCKTISSIEFPESLEIIRYNAFCGCKSLEGELYLPENLLEIGTEAFCLCANLQSIHFSKSLKVIGESAFWGCVSLDTSLNLPEGLKEIGDYAFYGCYSVKSLILPDSLERIGAEAFFYCAAILGDIHLPKNIKELGAGAFRLCDSIDYIFVPDSLEEENIGKDAFGLSKMLRVTE